MWRQEGRSCYPGPKGTLSWQLIDGDFWLFAYFKQVVCWRPKPIRQWLFFLFFFLFWRAFVASANRSWVHPAHSTNRPFSNLSGEVSSFDKGCQFGRDGSQRVWDFHCMYTSPCLCSSTSSFYTFYKDFFFCCLFLFFLVLLRSLITPLSIQCFSWQPSQSKRYNWIQMRKLK